MIFGKVLKKNQFYFCCFFYYLFLFLYFYLWRIVKNEADLPQGYEIIFRSILLILGAFLIVRPDFLWISYRTHQKIGKPTLKDDPDCSKGRFFLNSVIFYMSTILICVLLYELDDHVYWLIWYYLAFLSLTIFWKFHDYTIPSYNRYKRLVKEGIFNAYP